MKLNFPPLLLLLAILAFAFPAAHAQTPEEPPTEQLAPQPESTPVPPEPAPIKKTRPDYADNAKEKIAKVISEPPFKNTETVTRFRLKNQNEKNDSEPPTWLENFLDALRDIFRFLPIVGEVLLWALVAMLVFLLVVYRERWLKFFGYIRNRKVTAAPLPQTSTPLLFDRLPDDIAGAALKLWRDGEKTAALSVLYRGAVAGLGRGYQIALPDGATELEVLQEVSSQHPPLKDYMEALTSAWRRLAYAHRPPEQINDLIDGYRRHFEAYRS